MKSYQTRLMEYEAEKRKLQAAGLTPREYEREIRRIADKYKI